MSFSVKGQFNTPRTSDGRVMPVLQPDRYSPLDLISFAKRQGFDPFPNSDDPSNRPYWQSWATQGECPDILVSCTGIVAACFGGGNTYTVLQQQKNFQAPYPDAQKYLQVWFADNPNYASDSSAHDLHRLVGRLHCPYTEDCVYLAGDGYRLKSGLQLDHTDTDKLNNSSSNLRWISKELNQRLRSYKLEDKKRYIENLAVFDTDFIIQ
jgi:hypothetical protein